MVIQYQEWSFWHLKKKNYVVSLAARSDLHKCMITNLICSQCIIILILDESQEWQLTYHQSVHDYVLNNILSSCQSPVLGSACRACLDTMTHRHSPGPESPSAADNLLVNCIFLHAFLQKSYNIFLNCYFSYNDHIFPLWIYVILFPWIISLATVAPSKLFIQYFPMTLFLGHW